MDEDKIARRTLRARLGDKGAPEIKPHIKKEIKKKPKIEKNIRISIKEIDNALVSEYLKKDEFIESWNHRNTAAERFVKDIFEFLGGKIEKKLMGLKEKVTYEHKELYKKDLKRFNKTIVEALFSGRLEKEYNRKLWIKMEVTVLTTKEGKNKIRIDFHKW